MSRYYKIDVEVKKSKLVTEKKVLKIMTETFGWEENGCSEHKGIISFNGEGSLFGCMEESEAHKQILKEFRKINPKIKVLTRWTYMEELPYQEFGVV